MLCGLQIKRQQGWDRQLDLKLGQQKQLQQLQGQEEGQKEEEGEEQEGEDREGDQPEGAEEGREEAEEVEMEEVVEEEAEAEIQSRAELGTKTIARDEDQIKHRQGIKNKNKMGKLRMQINNSNQKAIQENIRKKMSRTNQMRKLQRLTIKRIQMKRRMRKMEGQKALKMKPKGELPQLE